MCVWRNLQDVAAKYLGGGEHSPLGSPCMVLTPVR